MSARDVRAMRAALEGLGFHVGARDPKRNTNFHGRYMVAETLEHEGGPDANSGDGSYCIVGDDLAELIREAYARFVLIPENAHDHQHTAP